MNNPYEPCLCGAWDCPECGALQGTLEESEDYFDEPDPEDYVDLNYIGPY